MYVREDSTKKETSWKYKRLNKCFCRGEIRVTLHNEIPYIKKKQTSQPICLSVCLCSPISGPFSSHIFCTCIFLNSSLYLWSQISVFWLYILWVLGWTDFFSQYCLRLVSNWRISSNWPSSASLSTCAGLLLTSGGRFSLFHCPLTDPVKWPTNPDLPTILWLAFRIYGEAKISISGPLYGHTHMHTHGQPKTIHTHTLARIRFHIELTLYIVSQSLVRVNLKGLNFSVRWKDWISVSDACASANAGKLQTSICTAWVGWGRQ